MTRKTTAAVRTLARSGLGASGLTAVLLAALVVAGPPASASWSVGLAGGSGGQSAAYGAPGTPSSVTSSCTSATTTTVKLTWPAVSRATSYSVYDSTTGAAGLYGRMASGLTATSYTTGSLLAGTFYFEVVATSGANWSGPYSSPSPGRVIGLGTCS